MRASRIVSSIVRASVSASARSAVRSVPCRLASISSPFRHMATRAATSSTITSTSIPDSVRNATKYVSLKSKNGPQRRLVLLGFGAIGQGVLPLLFRHIEMDPSQCIVISNEFSAKQKKQAKAFDVELIKEKLTKTDYLPALQKHLRKGDFLINVSVDVSSIALMEYCAANDILYMDTCNEPWAGGYSDPTQSGAARSNYAFREQALKLKKKVSATGPTALITHGANPGLVSHFVKAALLNIAKDTKHTLKHIPQTQAEWTQLAQDLGIKSIHISERDTQASKKVLKTEHEFVNTWSIDGFVEEGKQPAELGWGTHEKEFPVDGRKHDSGCDAAIYLDRPGAITRVRTWAPETGSFHGLLITHTEAISIADHFTKKDAHGKVVYRPTVHFAYHASNDAMQSMHEVAGKEWVKHSTERVMMDEIHSGRDELGVLLMGHAKGAYWYGSNLDVNYARELVDYNNATSLQVCTGVLTGVVWTLENPHRGIVEPEEIPHQRILEIGAPYLGKLHGEYSDWKPTNNRGVLFPEDVDNNDPWQFKNFRVL